MSKILGVLQNQWFHHPDRVRAMLAKSDQPAKLRRMLIARALFAGCRTGINLRKTFGEWCDRIVWDEASPEIGGKASSVFPADIAHLTGLLLELQPVAVIGFGTVACDALAKLCPEILIRAPHPTNRAGDTLRLLFAARTALEARF